jgi:uncharacterized protein
MKQALIILLIVASLAGCKERQPLNVLVIVGGHGYDTLAFHSFFDELEDLNITTLLQPQANRAIGAGMAEAFDVLVFYDSWQEISETEKQGYLNLLDKGTGMVFMHHTLVSYQDWPEFITIIGGKYHHPRHESNTDYHSDYRHDINMHVITDPDHPITRGIGSFDLFDEGYMNLTYLSTTTPILETDHAFSDEIIGWTHQVKNSRVVYLLPGHGAPAFENPTYRRIIQNAVNWVAAK